MVLSPARVHRAGAVAPGHVDHDVDAAEIVHHGVRMGGDGVLVAGIHLVGAVAARLVLDPVQERIHAPRAAVVTESQVCTVMREAAGDGPADGPGRAGDDGGFAVRRLEECFGPVREHHP